MPVSVGSPGSVGSASRPAPDHSGASPLAASGGGLVDVLGVADVQQVERAPLLEGDLQGGVGLRVRLGEVDDGLARVVGGDVGQGREPVRFPQLQRQQLVVDHELCAAHGDRDAIEVELERALLTVVAEALGREVGAAEHELQATPRPWRDLERLVELEAEGTVVHQDELAVLQRSRDGRIAAASAQDQLLHEDRSAELVVVGARRGELELARVADEDALFGLLVGGAPREQGQQNGRDGDHGVSSREDERGKSWTLSW